MHNLNPESSDGVVQLAGRVSGSERLDRDSILDSLTAQIAVLDRDGYVVATNAAWRRFSEQSNGDAWFGSGCGNTEIGGNYRDVCQASQSVNREVALAVADGIGRVLNGDLPIYSHEYPCHSPTQQRWFAMIVTPIGNKDAGAVLFHWEITKSKQFETELCQSESVLRSLVDAVPDLIWLKDPQGVYISCNTRFERFFGAYEAQIVGKTDYDFVGPFVIPCGS